MNTWFLAYFKAAAATSISFFKALVNPQTVAFYYFTNLRNRQKSPGLETGNPASITSTPISSNRFAITSFDWYLICIQEPVS
jgi:hypothetical protein